MSIREPRTSNIVLFPVRGTPMAEAGEVTPSQPTAYFQSSSLPSDGWLPVGEEDAKAARATVTPREMSFMVNEVSVEGV